MPSLRTLLQTHLSKNLPAGASIAICALGLAALCFFERGGADDVAAPRPTGRSAYRQESDLRVLSALMVPFHILTLGRTLGAEAEISDCRASLRREGLNSPCALKPEPTPAHDDPR